MSDDQLTPVPASFLALFAPEVGGPAMSAAWGPKLLRPQKPAGEVRARYELCEDLANHLVGSAQALHHDDGLSEEDVLGRCHQGLCDPASGFAAGEASWVVKRLAELLRWPLPLSLAEQA